MKLDQLIGNNMRNIFLEKTYTKCGGETTSTPISKNKVKHVFGSTVEKVEKYQNILMTKMSGQKFKYPLNPKSFIYKIKSIFHPF